MLSMGLKWVIHMPHIWVNHELLSALAEQWHNRHNTFQLSIDEDTITLEDVFYISSVPFYGEPMSDYVLLLIFFYVFDIHLACTNMIFPCHRYIMIKT